MVIRETRRKSVIKRHVLLKEVHKSIRMQAKVNV